MLCRTVCGPTDPAMTAIERIYVDSFPASERRPVSWLHDAAGRSDFSLFVVESDGDVAGFATLFLPTQSGEAALLDYLAVDSRSRSAGVGGCLFQAAITKVGDRPMLIEVETIGDSPGPRQRRQNFYRRHGCRRIVGVQYILPIPTVGKPPMEIMMANAPGDLRRADLERWLTTIYTRVYCCAANDPRLALMLAGAKEMLELN